MDFKCDELILGKKDADSRALTLARQLSLNTQARNPAAPDMGGMGGMGGMM